MRRTRRSRKLSHIASLPTELITAVLENLSSDELWVAARVSRQFYAAAWRAGLIIHRCIRWTGTSGHAQQLSVFKEVLQHAQLKDLRLGLDLWSYFHQVISSDQRKQLYHQLQPAAGELFAVISAALPFLDNLSIRIPAHFHAQLTGALQFPAHRLRRFELRYPMDSVPTCTTLPRDLFAGSAGQLRTLTLGSVVLPDDAVPAFKAVSHAVIVYGDVYPYIELARYFPHLTSLRLGFFVFKKRNTAVPHCPDLSDLELRGLVIDDDIEDDARSLLGAVERSMDLSSVPAVEVNGPPIVWTDKIWTKDAAEALCVRATFSDENEEQLELSVVPEHQRWRRRFSVSDWETQLPLPVGELPNLDTRLTYLRIDAPLVRGFLALDRAFPALRDLHVDVDDDSEALAPPDHTADLEMQAARVWTPCPALEEITLFAVDWPISGADARRVAFLAHALGQLEQPPSERAALALVGFEFARNAGARAMLAEVVSKIRRYAFAGFESPEDYDEGLWDCEFFDRE